MPAKKRPSATDPAITSATRDAAPSSLGKVPAPKKSASKRSVTAEAGSEKKPAAKTALSRTPKSAVQSDAAAPKAASTRRAKTAKGVETSEPAVATARVVTEDMIRQRAFYLSLEQGRASDPVAIWLEAERSLRRHFA